ncbi:hypothetical protein BG53_01075 [Paenibacillus darwinianus]|uniref:Uncharacterized protein n=1 Tax=Paenibacillus darwinianus TaxID=1380763 RepID=A0A9W5S151_9BACL|nr:hypothetical protein [Paenibacillus darwinianus]EXX88904.1 hypothetical protein BG53_01075 [Paenibacillus darwinianus]EXX89129.1 hypothetical protein BG52_00475 [Paenibacillus darwinianus]EXX90460.1 hypothetical protein CH50_15380 [Paenibacillus darwinianus]
MSYLWITYIAVLFGIVIAVTVVVVYLRMTKAGRAGGRAAQGENTPGAQAGAGSNPPPYVRDPNNPE